MTYILIVLLTMGQGTPLAVEFPNREACELAHRVLLNRTTVQSRPNVVAVCVPKGAA